MLSMLYQIWWKMTGVPNSPYRHQHGNGWTTIEALQTAIDKLSPNSPVSAQAMANGPKNVFRSNDRMYLVESRSAL